MFQNNERQLIEKVIVFDDHHAFEQLVKRYQSPVRQFLRRLTGYDDARSDDLAQDTFLQAYLYLSSYRGEGRFLSWLFKIAYQQFAKEHRQYKNHPVTISMDNFERASKDHGQLDRKIVLGQLLKTLPVQERATILLNAQFGLSHREIAETLTMPLGTVKTHILRGKDKLKTLYDSNKPGGNRHDS